MSESESVLAKLLAEAVETNTDQIVMISRSQQSHLYFLSKGRVKKAVPFQVDLAQAISEQLCHAEKPILWSEEGRNFSFECKSVPNEIGECLSLLIREVEKKLS